MSDKRFSFHAEPLGSYRASAKNLQKFGKCRCLRRLRWSLTFLVFLEFNSGPLSSNKIDFSGREFYDSTNTEGCVLENVSALGKMKQERPVLSLCLLQVVSILY